MPNIWTLDTPEEDTEKPAPVTEDSEAENEEELEKPSFLRRLAKRYKENSESDKTDKTD